MKMKKNNLLKMGAKINTPYKFLYINRYQNKNGEFNNWIKNINTVKYLNL